MLKFQVDPASLRSVLLALQSAQKFRDKMRDRKEAMEKVKRRQITRWARNFSTQGSIYGPWPALSPTWTIPERKALGFGAGPKLVRTGKLASWVTAQNQAGKVSAQAIDWNFSASGGKDGSYAVFHNDGYANPIPDRAPIPSRRIWDLDAQDETGAKDELEKWVDKIVKQYF